MCIPGFSELTKHFSELSAKFTLQLAVFQSSGPFTSIPTTGIISACVCMFILAILVEVWQAIM